MNKHHNPWQILDQKEIYDNPWIHLTEYDVINPNGGKGIYGKVHFKNAAIGIVPLDDELNIYLVSVRKRFKNNQKLAGLKRNQKLFLHLVVSGVHALSNSVV